MTDPLLKAVADLDDLFDRMFAADRERNVAFAKLFECLIMYLDAGETDALRQALTGMRDYYIAEAKKG